MKKKILLVSLCTLVFLFGLERLYYRQNGGFSIAKVISSVPPTATLSEFPEDNLLDQPFHFIGSGGTSYVFLGEDGKTVLKLFKHQHLVSSSFLFRIALPSISDAWRVRKILQQEKQQQHKRKGFFFNSCALANKDLKEESGLLFLCLQPDSHFARQIKLIDAWGIPHHLDLGRTEFALQKKADLLFPTLEKFIKNGQEKEAKAALDSLIALICRRCEKGIGDRDPNLQINFGFVDGKAIEFDLGSYFPNPSLKTPFATAKELFFSTYALRQWLENRSPELLEYLLKSMLCEEGKKSDNPI